jgi:hypothetical protein
VPLIRLERVSAVLPTARLLGQPAPDPAPPAAAVAEAVVKHAAGDTDLPPALGVVCRRLDGTRVCRFLSSVDPRLAQVKLDLLLEEVTVRKKIDEEGRVVFRRCAPPPPSGLFGGFAKKPPDSGLEVTVQLPEAGGRTGPVTIEARVLGTPPADFTEGAERDIDKLIAGIRRQLETVAERRKHPRVPADFALTVYPLHGDGRVEMPVAGTCVDVSAGGLMLTTAAPLPAKYMYVAFAGVPAADGLVLLAQVVRSEPRAGATCVTARYRLDLDVQLAPAS